MTTDDSGWEPFSFSCGEASSLETLVSIAGPSPFWTVSGFGCMGAQAPITARRADAITSTKYCFFTVSSLEIVEPAKGIAPTNRVLHLSQIGLFSSEQKTSRVKHM